MDQKDKEKRDRDKVIGIRTDEIKKFKETCGGTTGNSGEIGEWSPEINEIMVPVDNSRPICLPYYFEVNDSFQTEFDTWSSYTKVWNPGDLKPTSSSERRRSSSDRENRDQGQIWRSITSALNSHKVIDENYTNDLRRSSITLEHDRRTGCKMWCMGLRTTKKLLTSDVKYVYPYLYASVRFKHGMWNIFTLNVPLFRFMFSHRSASTGNKKGKKGHIYLKGDSSTDPMAVRSRGYMRQEYNASIDEDEGIRHQVSVKFHTGNRDQMKLFVVDDEQAIFNYNNGRLAINDLIIDNILAHEIQDTLERENEVRNEQERESGEQGEMGNQTGGERAENGGEIGSRFMPDIYLEPFNPDWARGNVVTSMESGGYGRGSSYRRYGRGRYVEEANRNAVFLRLNTPADWNSLSEIERAMHSSPGKREFK